MKYLYGFLLICFIVSCSSSAEKSRFEKKGVSIECPDGWSITEEDSLGGEGYFLSIEKEGLDESGILSITWVEGDITAEDFLASMQEGISTNIVYDNSNLKMSEPFKTSFGDQDAVACEYSCSLIGIKQEGTIYAFYGTDKVISILKQGALEDKKENDEGFALLEKSFVSK